MGGPTGFGENTLARGDDLGSAAIDLLSIFDNGLDLFGVVYSELWINTNGTITFSGPLSSSSPQTIDGSIPAGIFPFWTDIDTRNQQAASASPGGTSQGTNLVYYEFDPINDRLVVTWDDVGYFPSSNDYSNAFQLVIQDRSSSPGRSVGDFDIELRYEWIDWTAGGYFADGYARAGFSAGDGEHYFELPQSGDHEALLQLESSVGNTGEPGLWQFEIRNGSAPQNISILAEGDMIEGDTGTTPLSFTLERTGETSGTLSVDWYAAGTSAHPARPGDVATTLPLSGSIFFDVGETTHTLSIPIQGDLYPEFDERVVVSIENPVSSTTAPVILEQPFATAAILDDDTPAPPAPSNGPSAFFVGTASIMTFDGLFYELRAAGEFTLCQFGDGGDFEIQLRTEATGGNVTAATSVAMNVLGHRVTLDPSRSAPLYINGTRTVVDELQGPLEIGNTGALLYRNAEKYTLILPDGDQFIIEMDSFGYISVSSHLAAERPTGQVLGLWGNANDTFEDDLSTRDGSTLNTPSSQAEFTTSFLNEWRIEDSFSFFDRRLGELTDNWQDLTPYYLPLALSDLPLDLRERAQAAAQALDDFPSLLHEVAVLDFALTGNPFFIDNFTELEITPERIIHFTSILPDEACATLVSGATTQLVEGNSGTRDAVFWIDRIGNLSEPLALSYVLSGDIARSDLINMPMSGNLSFSAGQSRLYFVVQITGDSEPEPDEDLIITIATSDAVQLNNSATLIVLDDDSTPILTGTSSQETLSGDAGSNVIFGFKGKDFLLGGGGDDALFGGSGNDSLEGGNGADFLDGGGGQDIASYVFSTGRVMVDLQNEAYDFGDAVGDTYISIEIFQTGRGPDQLRGDERGNVFYTGAFSDRLYGRSGNDVLFGESGADAFYGGLGADVMTGGDGDIRDRFIYFAISETGVGQGNRDIITDFQPGADRIEISRFDADTTLGFKQRFVFIDDAVFSGQAGELRWFAEQEAGFTLVQGDTDGDTLPDFEIELTGLLELTPSDFLL